VADAYVIEAHSRAAGLAVRDRRGFRFFAAEQPFFALDKCLFPSLRAIRRAVETVAKASQRRPRAMKEAQACGQAKLCSVVCRSI
jgi:hypothetical protein